MREEWRCALIMLGELSVMTPGILLMPLLFASSWDMVTLQVCLNIFVS